MKPLLDKFTLPVTVLAILFLFKFLNPSLDDPDFYWHLKTGEYIFSHSAVPMTDPFAFTSIGMPWVAHEWLTELVLYGAMQFLGFTGIRLLVATMLCASFYLLFQLTQKLVNGEAKALIIASAFFAALMPYWSPRPQIFTFFFFSTYLWLLLDYKYAGSSKRFWLLPAIMVLWVNLHGAFLVGIALVLIFLVTEWAMHFYASRDNRMVRKDLTRLSIFSWLTCLATLINPQFFHIWAYPFQLVSMEVAKGAIAEWQSPNFHLLFYKIHLTLIIAFFLAFIYSRKKPDLTELFIPLFFISAGLVSQRHLPLTSFVLLGFFGAIYRHIEVPFNLSFTKKYQLIVSQTAKSEVNPLFASVINLSLFLIVVALVGSGAITQEKDEETLGMIPVGAANYIRENRISGNMFNDYNFGGYLIYKLAPTQKVFIDGRADLYGDKFVNDYLDIYSGKAGWKEKFEKFSIDYVICDKNSALRQLLLSEGSFKEGYSDKFHSVLLRNGPKFQALLAHNKEALKQLP
jgi:hypothetical protein